MWLQPECIFPLSLFTYYVGPSFVAGIQLEFSLYFLVFIHLYFLCLYSLIFLHPLPLAMVLILPWDPESSSTYIACTPLIPMAWSVGFPLIKVDCDRSLGLVGRPPARPLANIAGRNLCDVQVTSASHQYIYGAWISNSSHPPHPDHTSVGSPASIAR
jgi:hypothetical protein